MSTLSATGRGFTGRMISVPAWIAWITGAQASAWAAKIRVRAAGISPSPAALADPGVNLKVLLKSARAA